MRIYSCGRAQAVAAVCAVLLAVAGSRTRGGSLKEAPVTMSEEDLMAIYSRVTATISNLEDFQNDHTKVFSTRPHG